MTLRDAAKSVVFGAARRSGLNWFSRARRRRDVLVLAYHAVLSDDHPRERYRCRNAVSVAELRAQLETVVRLFTPVSTADVLAWITERRPLPDHPVLITFDDGYRSTLEVAAPELERLGVPGMVAVTTGSIGSTDLLWTHELDERVLQWNAQSIPLPDGGQESMRARDVTARIALAERLRSTCKALPTPRVRAYLDSLRGQHLHLSEWQHQLYDFMTWDEVRAIRRRGWSVSSHTVTHPILSRVDTPDIRSELMDSRARIERETGESCVTVVYPNGGERDVDDRCVQAAADAGYAAGFMLTGHAFNGWPLRRGPLRIDRACVVGQLSESAFLFYVSGLKRP